MGWKDDLENIKFSIKTGDGKEYFPLWKDSEKSKDYNSSAFDFIDVSGTFVDRKKPKGNKYPLTFYFQGDDCITQSNEFENSADDSRAWEITHPFYGTIKGQPLSLKRNDNNYNVTEITVDFWESITDDYPISDVSVKDEVLSKRNLVSQSAVTSYSSSENVLQSEDITKNKDANILTNSAFDTSLENDDFADYQIIFGSAQKATDDLLNNASNAIEKTNELLNFPSGVDLPVLVKVKNYVNAFENLVKELQTIADKLFFESQAGLCISNLCNASVNYQETDFEIRNEVEQVVNEILIIYAQYLLILDNASVSIYDVGNTYQPDAGLQNDVYNIVMFTIGNLYNLAFNAKQERLVYTTKDTNLILLTHKYLGLDASDENIDKFRQINNIKMNELFNVKKDRLIKYYV